MLAEETGFEGTVGGDTDAIATCAKWGAHAGNETDCALETGNSKVLGGVVRVGGNSGQRSIMMSDGTKHFGVGDKTGVLPSVSSKGHVLDETNGERVRLGETDEIGESEMVVRRHYDDV